jgi:ribosome-associated protein
MVRISERLFIPDTELQWTFVRAGGPGGQNVNKVASKAVLRWNVAVSPSLPEEVKARLRSQQAGRITTEGDLLVSSQRFRDQERNRQDCLDKLGEMLRQAAVRPRPRKPTRPTRASRRRRQEAKLHRGRTKAGRRAPSIE